VFDADAVLGVGPTDALNVGDVFHRIEHLNVLRLDLGQAQRGETALERLRTQPLFAENIERAEKAYNDAVELTEDALGVVSAQTRAGLLSMMVSGGVGLVNGSFRPLRTSGTGLLDWLVPHYSGRLKYPARCQLSVTLYAVTVATLQ